MWILSRKPFLDRGLKNVLYQFLVQTGVGLKGLKGVDQVHCPHREVKLPSDPADGYVDYIPGGGYGLKKDHGYGPQAKEEVQTKKHLGPGPFKPDERNIRFEKEPNHSYASKDVESVRVNSQGRDSEFRNAPGTTYVTETKNSEQSAGETDELEDHEDPRLAYSDDYHKPSNDRKPLSNSKEETEEEVKEDDEEVEETRDVDPRDRYQHDEVKIQLGERVRDKSKTTNVNRRKPQDSSRRGQYKATAGSRKELDSTTTSNQTNTAEAQQTSVSSVETKRKVEVDPPVSEDAILPKQRSRSAGRSTEVLKRRNRKVFQNGGENKPAFPKTP